MPPIISLTLASDHFHDVQDHFHHPQRLQQHHQAQHSLHEQQRQHSSISISNRNPLHPTTSPVIAATAFPSKAQSKELAIEKVGPTGFEPKEPGGIDDEDLLQWKKDALEPEEGVGLFAKVFGKKRKKAPGLPGGEGDDDEALLHSITKARAAAKQADDAAERASEAVRLAMLRAKGITEAVSQTEHAWKGAESAAWLASTRPQLDSAFEAFQGQQKRASDFLNFGLSELTQALGAPKSYKQADQLFRARTTIMNAEKELKTLLEDQVPSIERAHHTYQANLAHAAHPTNHALVGQAAPHERTWPQGKLGIWPASVKGPRVAGPGDAVKMPETGLDFLHTMQETEMRDRLKASLTA